MICHTINPRLFPEQLTYIINDANDKVLMFDKTFVALIASIQEEIPNVQHFVCMSEADPEITKVLPGVKFYDELVAAQKQVLSGLSLMKIQQVHYVIPLELQGTQKEFYIHIDQRFYIVL